MSTRRKMPPSNPTTQSTGNAVQQARLPILRTIGLGLITGAADDDCSAIGTMHRLEQSWAFNSCGRLPSLCP